MKRHIQLPLNRSIAPPLSKRMPPIKQAIGGRAVKTSSATTPVVAHPVSVILPELPAIRSCSVACLLADGVSRKSLVEAGLIVPGRTMINTVGLVYEGSSASDADIVLEASSVITWTKTLDILRASNSYDMLVWLSSREAVDGLLAVIKLLEGSPHWFCLLPGKASCVLNLSNVPNDLSSESIIKTIRSFVALGKGMIAWGGASS